MAVRIERVRPDAVEGSTYVITAAFTDEDGDAVVPDSATWTLCDVYGDIVNSRESVAISPLSSSVSVVLSGDDLPAETLYFLVEATYTSTYGSGLPLRGQVYFNVVDVID